MRFAIGLPVGYDVPISRNHFAPQDSLQFLQHRNEVRLIVAAGVFFVHVRGRSGLGLLFWLHSQFAVHLALSAVKGTATVRSLRQKELDEVQVGELSGLPRRYDVQGRPPKTVSDVEASSVSDQSLRARNRPRFRSSVQRRSHAGVHETEGVRVGPRLQQLAKLLRVVLIGVLIYEWFGTWPVH